MANIVGSYKPIISIDDDSEDSVEFP